MKRDFLFDLDKEVDFEIDRKATDTFLFNPFIMFPFPKKSRILLYGACTKRKVLRQCTGKLRKERSDLLIFMVEAERNHADNYSTLMDCT